jgi:hypothetical protein
MAKGPKRTKIEREADLVEIARLYLKKQTQQEIADHIGLSRQQITYDLKTIQARWQADTTRATEERKAEEVAGIEHLERTYWDAWDRSIGVTTITTKTAEAAGADGAKQKATVRTEELNGDPRYLLGVQWCKQKRIDILGLDAPRKHEVTGEKGGPIRYENMDDAELNGCLAELIKRRENRDGEDS